MKIKFKDKDLQFIVKPEERIVVCIIKSYENGKPLTWMVPSYMQKSATQINYYTTYAVDEKIRMPKTFVGKAVCAPEDEWNEELGRTLALKRAKYKLFTSFFKRAQTLVDAFRGDVNGFIDNLDNLGDSIMENLDSLDAKVESMMPAEKE